MITYEEFLKKYDMQKVEKIYFGQEESPLTRPLFSQRTLPPSLALVPKLQY